MKKENNGITLIALAVTIIVILILAGVTMSTLTSEDGNIKSVITSIKDEYISSLQIIKGKVFIKTKDKKQQKAEKAVGIEENPYDITDDGELLSSNNNS